MFAHEAPYPSPAPLWETRRSPRPGVNRGRWTAAAVTLPFKHNSSSLLSRNTRPLIRAGRQTQLLGAPPLEAGFPVCWGGPWQLSPSLLVPRERLLVVVWLAEPLRAVVGDGGQPGALTEPLTGSGGRDTAEEKPRDGSEGLSRPGPHLSRDGWFG